VSPPSFAGVLIVAAVAFLVPLLLALAPRVHLPAGALELAVGIAIGPGLGWVEPDAAITVLAALGLAFLLFLAGLEVDLAHVSGGLLRRAGLAFLASAALAAAVGYALQGAALVDSGLFVAIVLSGSYLGAIATLIHDLGAAGSEVGRLTIAGAAVANVAAVVLLTLFASGEASEVGGRLVLLAALVGVAGAVTLGVWQLERSRRLSAALSRLGDTSAQIRVRGAFVLLVGFVALARPLGVEVILAAFTAGVVLGLIDRDAMRTHPQLQIKLDGAGYGFFIPVFLVAAGLNFDLDGLVESPSHLLMAPLFLAALLVVRGLPALLYRPLVGGPQALAAGLMQSISLPLIVVATQVGEELGAVDPPTAAALVAAGLASLVILPEAAGAALRRGEGRTALPAAHGDLRGGR
jgi:Kef-type K+ transport system membrane component KefB